MHEDPRSADTLNDLACGDLLAAVGFFMLGGRLGAGSLLLGGGSVLLGGRRGAGSV